MIENGGMKYDAIGIDIAVPSDVKTRGCATGEFTYWEQGLLPECHLAELGIVGKR